MKSCIGCVHADWAKTANGRLHPSGDGRCTYSYQLPPLPVSMYWIFFYEKTPSGGYINRRRDSDKVCPTREVRP